MNDLVLPSTTVLPIAGESCAAPPSTGSLLAHLGLHEPAPGHVSDRTRAACRAIAEAKIDHAGDAAAFARYQRTLRAQLRRAPLRVSHRSPQRARTARRAAPRKPAAASGEDSEGSEPPGGVERVAIATVDPHGRDVVVLLHVNVRTTTPAEMVRMARLAVGHSSKVAEYVEPGLRWQTLVPGVSKGGAA